MGRRQHVLRPTFVMVSTLHGRHTAHPQGFALPRSWGAIGAPSLALFRTVSMPRYHFYLVDSQTVADKGGHELPDNATAENVAKHLAERLRGDLPELRNRNFAIVVTDEDGERVCRIPIDLSN